jgi:hypothetical protein
MLCVLVFVASAYAAFPGANGKIAFEGIDSVGNEDIYTVQPDGSGVTRLTDDPVWDRAP